MTRDYKHRQRKPARKPVPGWVWMLTGLMLGLLVALLVYLGTSPRAPAPADTAEENKLTEKKPAPVKKESTARKNESEGTGVRYEFYTLLPESEVVIPEQDVVERGSGATPSESYILQAGSFRKQQEAETLRARLALLGVESSIEKVTVHGDTWHRIRIGPLTSLRDINEIRNRLRKNDINAILIKAKN